MAADLRPNGPPHHHPRFTHIQFELSVLPKDATTQRLRQWEWDLNWQPFWHCTTRSTSLVTVASNKYTFSFAKNKHFFFPDSSLYILFKISKSMFERENKGESNVSMTRAKNWQSLSISEALQPKIL